MQDEGQDEGIRWDLYPHVAAIPQARAFILRLRQLSRRPKTVDAYARNLDRFVASFAGVAAERWVEADEGVLLTYLDDLRHGREPGPSSRARRGRPENVRHLSGGRAAEATIAQHVVALRQFYDYLIRAHIRRDSINPLPRGSTGRHGEGEASRRGLGRART